ncbi:MAG: hypothetical protein GKR90_05600 [Pseudomonadales bacterium]|nr:hypothetical protein [Pseudomonadales bacterium]
MQKLNEKRAAPRIKLPLLVELSHATLGTVEVTARDVSDGGLFVELEATELTTGAQAKVKLRSTHIAEFQHTPTVDVRVTRVAEDGVALEFKNKTAQHLWSSVERLRDELEVGKDYFQIYQLAVAVNSERGMLLVQQHGKWTFPGAYLEVPDQATDTLHEVCRNELGITPTKDLQPLLARTLTHMSLPEAATFCIAYLVETTDLRPQPATKDWRWIRKVTEFSDITVAFDLIREVGELVLSNLDKARDPRA